MAFATFADPTVAIEPPPQPWEFDSSWLNSQEISDPFGAAFGMPDTAAVAASTPASSSWTDIAKGVGQNFLRDLAGAVGGKVTGYGSPSVSASSAAALAAQQQAEQQKLFLIVGGVGLAVVLGALVLRKKR